MLRIGAMFGTLVVAGALAFVVTGDGETPPWDTGDDGATASVANPQPTAGTPPAGEPAADRTLVADSPLLVPPPRSAGALLVDPRAAVAANLQDWARNTNLDRATRYAALRRFEERGDGAELVALAASLLDDPERLIQRNALAVLARSRSPRAREILADLDPRSRRIAELLSRGQVAQKEDDR